MRSICIAMAVAAALGFAATLAPGQAAPASTPVSAGSLRLRIVEPPEGAIIPGGSVRVAIAREPLEAGDGAPREATVLVFVDGVQQSSLLANENSLTIEGVLPGGHRLSVLAIDRANELVDRRDVSISTVEVASPQASAVQRPGGRGILSLDSLERIDPVLAGLAGLALAVIGATLLATRKRVRRPDRLRGGAAGRL